MKKISLKTTSSFAAAGCVTAMIGLCSSPAFAAPALQGYVMRV
ncbi:MAG TPA: ribonuclease I, partial [Acinetobacter radioresistens]|nr:ribonuclease I [Acinetobacter radioresistens]